MGAGQGPGGGGKRGPGKDPGAGQREGDQAGAIGRSKSLRAE